MLRKLATLGALTLASLLFCGCGPGGGGGNSLGNDTNSTATIGPNGGTLDDGNGLKITIPAGALNQQRAD